MIKSAVIREALSMIDALTVDESETARCWVSDIDDGLVRPTLPWLEWTIDIRLTCAGPVQ